MGDEITLEEECLRAYMEDDWSAVYYFVREMGISQAEVFVNTLSGLINEVEQGINEMEEDES